MRRKNETRKRAAALTSQCYNVLMHIHMYVGALIGFTDIGDINSHLDEYENQLANKELRAPLATPHSLFSEQQVAWKACPQTHYQIVCKGG